MASKSSAKFMKAKEETSYFSSRKCHNRSLVRKLLTTDSDAPVNSGPLPRQRGTGRDINETVAGCAVHKGP